MAVRNARGIPNVERFSVRPAALRFRFPLVFSAPVLTLSTMPARNASTALVTAPPLAAAWRDLLRLAARLPFQKHDIRAQLDSTGRYELPLPAAFPFTISLFHYTSQDFTRGVTWHERLELFMPLDGRVDFRTGESTLRLAPGDLLIVDNMKPHHVVDHPGFDTRVIVISFLPEFVYSPGASPHDYTFLLPFFSKVDGSHHVVQHRDACAAAVYAAAARLLGGFFQSDSRFRETACKAWFLVLLNELAQRFQDAPDRLAGFLRQRERAARFSPLLARIHRQPQERLTLTAAARVTGMSQSQFTRQFRLATGMGLIAYVTRVRLAGAARQLKHGSQTIAEIAADAGFSDQSYFDRCFKKAYGQTPRDFRQSLPR